MNIWKKFEIAVRRRETPFHDRVYRIAKNITRFHVPCIRPLHSVLYHEWLFRRDLWHSFWRVFYYEPMFKSQCFKVGLGFRMEYAGNGSTRVFGNPKITLGSNVTIYDNTFFVGLKVFDDPEILIGDNTIIGPRVRLMAGKRIEIGSNCLIASDLIADNAGHPRDVMDRLGSKGGSPSTEEIQPISIGDFCFFATGTVVYPGVSIGDGVIARFGTHIDRHLPPFCLVAGNPIRILKLLPIPPGIEGIVGEKRYKSYLSAHENWAPRLSRGRH